MVQPRDGADRLLPKRPGCTASATITTPSPSSPTDERRVLGQAAELPGREGPAAAGRVLGARRVPGAARAAADRPGPDGTRRAHGARCGAGAARGIYQGFRIFELARTDASLATLYTAQAGLFRTAIRVGASAEQQAEWMPKVIDFSLKGVFSLTEPESGSDIAGGLSTTRPPRGRTSWVLDGAKRWIGGAATADVLAVFARDVADGQVKAFLVDRRGGRRDAGEDPRQDRVADDAERPHHPRRRPGARVHAPAQCELLPGRRRDAPGHALGRRLDRHRHRRPARSKRPCATSPNASSSAARSDPSSWSRKNSPGCSATSPPRCPWWSG